jgi:hypothetical protein
LDVVLSQVSDAARLATDLGDSCWRTVAGATSQPVLLSVTDT